MTANRSSTGIAQFVRALQTQSCADQTDGQLLSRFLSGRDEAAFGALVRRHGAMVLAVCHRVLANAADAEDAFQATFLVLVRKARALTARAVLGDWLHGVARRTALSARRAAALRRTKEQAMARPDVQDQVIQDDWLPLLDEELRRLPKNYRLPIVLCDLEGKTRQEAADHLGWPPGTVAGRLARGRALLARRLLRQGGAVSGTSLVAALAQSAASAYVSEALVHSTANAASLLMAGTGAATAMISARVAALTEGVVRAMFLAKLTAAACALALTVLVALGGAALLPGDNHLPMAGAAAPQPVSDATSGPDARKLVRQLGSLDFADREAAHVALANLGARAAAAVRAGMRDTDPEIARRCEAIWPRLWQIELGRPNGDRLAGYAHRLWARFRKVAGDDPGSRTLFAEMVADVQRFGLLEAVEADPDKAGAAYAAELKLRVEAMKRAYQKAEEAAQGRSGDLWPAGGIPTRGEFAALLFLGTYPSTAAVTYPKTDYLDGFSYHHVFHRGLRPDDRAKAEAIPPAVRRLFVAWLGTRTDPTPIEFGLSLALNTHHIAEAVPLARRKAADAALAPHARGYALLGVGRFGTPADLPVLEKAFADSRVFYPTEDKLEDGKKRPVEVRVSDAAVAAALHLAGQHPADFGFTFLEKYKQRGPDDFLKFHLLGFFDDETRQAAHKKAREWLDEHRKERLRALIDTVLAAHGGEDRLKKLTSFIMKVKHSNGETQHYFVQPPSNFRWETTHPDRTSKRIVILFPNGRRWWKQEPNQEAQPFFPTGAERTMEYHLDYVKFFGPRQVLRLKDADHRLALVDQEAKIGDRWAVGVEVTGPQFKRTMYFDKESHLLLKSGAVTYSDYKTVDGFPVAQKEDDGYLMPQVTDFRVVDKFDAKLFEKP